MIIVNTGRSRQMAQLRDLAEFAKEHSMTVYEWCELARQYLDINLQSPSWRRVATRLWLGLPPDS